MSGWDLVNYMISILIQKRKEIVVAVKNLLKEKFISRRQQESILGSLQFALITDPVLRANLKDIGKIWQKRG